MASILATAAAKGNGDGTFANFEGAWWEVEAEAEVPEAEGLLRESGCGGGRGGGCVTTFRRPGVAATADLAALTGIARERAEWPS